jgi:hypothetical protein
MSDFFVRSCLASVPHLSQLTLLRIKGRLFSSCQQLVQQVLAQPLPLRQLVLSVDNLPVLNMAALTCLEELNCNSSSRIMHWHHTVMPAGSVLPRQLQRLALGKCRTASSLQMISELQQLRSMSLVVYFTESEPLLQLGQLPALQHIALEVRITVLTHTQGSLLVWAAYLKRR